MMWEDLVPRYVAQQQRSWERRRQVRRMVALGINRQVIAARLGVSAGMVGILYRQSLNDRLCPILRYGGAVALEIKQLAI